MTAHIAHPDVLLQAVAPLAGMFLWGAGGMFDSSSLSKQVFGAPVGPVIDLKRPLDVAWVHTPGKSGPDSSGPDIAVSVALVEASAALRGLAGYFTFAPDGQGGEELKSLGDKKMPAPCAIAPAFDATRRLVCASSFDVLRHLWPYLTRTMARMDPALDVSAEFFPDEGPELGESDKGADTREYQFSKTLWSRSSRQFVHDVETVGVEARSESGQLDTRLTVRFKKGDTPLVRAILGEARGLGEVPAAFERLPFKTGLAAFGRGASAEDLQLAQATFAAGLRADKAQAGVDSAGTAFFVSWLDRVFLTGGPWVVAVPPQFDAARVALDAVVTDRKRSPADRSAARTARKPPMLFGVQEPAQKWIDAFNLDFAPSRPRSLPRRREETRGIA
jgi:hypothetical protein